MDFQTFDDSVYGWNNVVILIQLKGECIIGGYTKTGWQHTKSGYSVDPDAFIFHLQSPDDQIKPFIVDIKQDEESVSKALFCDWEVDKIEYAVFEWAFHLEGDG